MAEDDIAPREIAEAPVVDLTDPRVEEYCGFLLQAWRLRLSEAAQLELRSAAAELLALLDAAEKNPEAVRDN